MRRFSAIASGPICPANHGRFNRPTPCSPVIAAEAYCKVHDFAERDLGTLFHRRVAGVVDDQRVSVAVAGMRDDRDHHVAVGGDARDSRHEIAQAGQRHTDVLEQQRPLGLHCRNREPTGSHERLTLVGVIGGEDFRRTVFRERCRPTGRRPGPADTFRSSPDR
jgi:hypothetical protein